MVFILLEHYYHVLTTPENDVMGCVTQLIMKYLSGQTVPYLEYYEFFENSVIAGVPDYIPEPVTDGPVTVLPAAFGLLNTSLLCVSKVKTGYVTCARLAYMHGRYRMHVYTGEAKNAARMERIRLGRSRAAAAVAGDLPRFVHRGRICAERLLPARHRHLRRLHRAAARLLQAHGY